MRYRIFEEVLGKKGVRIAVENDLIFPVTYRDIRNENGELVFEGQIQEAHLDDQFGEGFYLVDKLIIVSGSVTVNKYFEILDDFERPYIDKRLSEEFFLKLHGMPLFVNIHDYPGLTKIEVRPLLETDTPY
jgi:hypothetical protein